MILLTWLVNQLQRNRPIDMKSQILASFGGLRGAIAFSLAHMLTSKHSVMFETTIMFIILFTVFVMGISTKPLALMFRIKRRRDETRASTALINNAIIEMVVPVVERYSGFGSCCPGLQSCVERVNAWLLPRFVVGGVDRVRRREDPFHKVCRPPLPSCLLP